MDCCLEGLGGLGLVDLPAPQLSDRRFCSWPIRGAWYPDLVGCCFVFSVCAHPLAAPCSSVRWTHRTPTRDKEEAACSGAVSVAPGPWPLPPAGTEGARARLPPGICSSALRCMCAPSTPHHTHPSLLLHTPHLQALTTVRQSHDRVHKPQEQQRPNPQS